LQGLHCARCQCTKGVARPQVFRVKLEQLQVFFFTRALVDGGENFGYPWQAFPARRAPSARFLREELFEVLHEADWTGLVVEDNERAGTEAATRSGDVGVVHLDVEVFFDKEI